MTTKELVNSIIDLQFDLLLDPDDIETKKELQKLLAQLKIKVDNIDSFVLNIRESIAKIEARINVFREEIDRMRKRKQAIENFKEYFEVILLPMAIETIGKDGVLETDTARYKVYETFGKIKVDESSLADDYWRETITRVPDKKGLRELCKKLIAQNKELPNGVSLNKIKKVRRT